MNPTASSAGKTLSQGHMSAASAKKLIGRAANGSPRAKPPMNFYQPVEGLEIENIDSSSDVESSVVGGLEKFGTSLLLCKERNVASCESFASGTSSFATLIGAGQDIQTIDRVDRMSELEEVISEGVTVNSASEIVSAFIGGCKVEQKSSNISKDSKDSHLSGSRLSSSQASSTIRKSMSSRTASRRSSRLNRSRTNSLTSLTSSSRGRRLMLGEPRSRCSSINNSIPTSETESEKKEEEKPQPSRLELAKELDTALGLEDMKEAEVKTSVVIEEIKIEEVEAETGDKLVESKQEEPVPVNVIENFDILNTSESVASMNNEKTSPLAPFPTTEEMTVIECAPKQEEDTKQEEETKSEPESKPAPEPTSSQSVTSSISPRRSRSGSQSHRTSNFTNSNTIGNFGNFSFGTFKPRFEDPEPTLEEEREMRIREREEIAKKRRGRTDTGLNSLSARSPSRSQSITQSSPVGGLQIPSQSEGLSLAQRARSSSTTTREAASEYDKKRKSSITPKPKLPTFSNTVRKSISNTSDNDQTPSSKGKERRKPALPVEAKSNIVLRNATTTSAVPVTTSSSLSPIHAPSIVSQKMNLPVSPTPQQRISKVEENRSRTPPPPLPAKLVQPTEVKTETSIPVVQSETPQVPSLGDITDIIREEIAKARKEDEKKIKLLQQQNERQLRLQQELLLKSNKQEKQLQESKQQVKQVVKVVKVNESKKPNQPQKQQTPSRNGTMIPTLQLPKSVNNEKKIHQKQKPAVPKYQRQPPPSPIQEEVPTPTTSIDFERLASLAIPRERKKTEKAILDPRPPLKIGKNPVKKEEEELTSSRKLSLTALNGAQLKEKRDREKRERDELIVEQLRQQSREREEKINKRRVLQGSNSTMNLSGYFGTLNQEEEGLSLQHNESLYSRARSVKETRIGCENDVSVGSFSEEEMNCSSGEEQPQAAVEYTTSISTICEPASAREYTTFISTICEPVSARPTEEADDNEEIPVYENNPLTNVNLEEEHPQLVYLHPSVTVVNETIEEEPVEEDENQNATTPTISREELVEKAFEVLSESQQKHSAKDDVEEDLKEYEHEDPLMPTVGDNEHSEEFARELLLLQMAAENKEEDN